jgi:hypothetical protein
VATNLAQAGTGRFSQAVLAELQAQPLWPDMPELARQIKANFRDQQHLEPVFWSFSLGGGDREVTDTISQRITARPVPAIAMSTSERLQLIQTLNNLPIVEFEVLVKTLNPPGGIMPPPSAAQGLRSSALLDWIEGPTGPGLNELQAVLGQVMVGSITPPSPPKDVIPPPRPSHLQVPPELSVEEKKQFRAALKHAFPKRVHLAAMLEDEMGDDLDSITYNEPDYEIALRALVTWAETEGKLQNLLEGALHVKSGNPKLKELKQMWSK